MDTFNNDWKFTLEERTDFHLLDIDESNFIDVNLPHDYSITMPYNDEIGEGCTAYLPGGIGLYRKHIKIDFDVTDKKIFIYFDGIYNRSNIYFNEQFITFHPYGYSPLIVDVTDYVKEGDNVLAVSVDHSRYADSRWYTGSGIYRKAELHILEKTHIPIYGVTVDTDVKSKEIATVTVSSDIVDVCESIQVSTKILDPYSNIVATSDDVVDESKKLVQTFSIENLLLWDIFKGNLYKAVTTISTKSKILQQKTTTFGIRYFNFDVNEGFSLNGEKRLIKGVCLHHDCGIVGAAVPLDVIKRRLVYLKEIGCNAIRTAHNPASKDFLRLCDEMGFLVQEEFYDEWDNPKDKRHNQNEREVDFITRGHHEFFKDYAQFDLQNVVRRDINCPSIIQWSIGNEIEWTYPKYNVATGYFDANANGNYFFNEPPFSAEKIRENVKNLPRELYEVGDTAKKLSKWVKELDTTRPVIANCILPSASHESGYVDALDIVGYSYRRVVYNRNHEAYPNIPIMGAENLPQWHEWKAVLDREFISGIFLWTGADYLGECGKGRERWPQKATASGLLDVAGFKKPSYYMFKTLWSDKPTLFMATQTLEKSLYKLDSNENLVYKEDSGWEKRLWVWQDVNEHYNYEDGENIVVEVYSNSHSVTLYLNNEPLETKYLKDFEDRIYKWVLPFTEGTLTAKGENCSASLATAGDPTHIILSCDKNTINHNDFDSVVHIKATLIDSVGNFVKFKDAKIEFMIKGDAKILGVDNGDPSFVGNHFDTTQIETYRGKALLALSGNSVCDIEVCVKYFEEEHSHLTIHCV